jgi:hypothetical protein
MFRKLGWAAFLAFSSQLLTLQAGIAGEARPTYACFSPANAAMIGRLGAADPSVRHGFETGECLALRPGSRLSDVQRQGSLWRFRAFGAAPYLYAADWAAGFDPAAPASPPGYEQYLAVSDRLLAMGSVFASCAEAYERLEARFDEHERRWLAYKSRSRIDVDSTPSPVVIKHVADTGPMLEAEANEIRKEARRLEQRCGAVTALDTDADFVAFMRSAQV